MPGGFENSAMKNSFSLSSLQPPAGFPESPERARLRLERPYNSLTKKSRRDPEQEGWRRSWGSHNKDEFWAALQSDYDYLMDNNLIDTCKEASGDLSVYTHAASSDGDWSFNQFTAHFLELYSWLNSIQEAVYGKEETVTDRGLRTSHMERMQREGFRRRMFNEQSTRLLVRYPDLRDEVAWRVAHLNAKWETLELAMSPSTGASSQRDMCTDVEHEVRCLRKWVREMEARLQPLDFRAGINWTYAELEQRAKEHMVLQRDVESHGKIVSSVVKLCERVAQLQRKQLQQEQPQPRQHDLLRVARRLERRWHHLFLRSLEWQCHLETLATKLPPAPEPSHSDSDEGPASKQPRLSLSHPAHPGHEDEEQRRRRRQRAASSLMDTTEPPQPHHHPRTMVGASTGIKATIKRRRKQGGRPRGSPPPPPTDTMTAAELSAAPAPAMLTTGTAPDVNHNVTVVAATNNINNNNKRTRNDNGRFSNRLDQSPNVAYYQFRYTDMDSDRQEHPGHSDHADDLSLDDDDDDLLDEDLLDHPHDMAHDDNNNAHRGHLLSTASAGSLSDLAAGRPTEASASDTDEEWTYHAQVNGNVNGNANGNTNGNLNGSRHFSENVSVPKMSPMRSSKECIQRLVNQAEQLVRCGAQGEDLPRAPETTLVSPAGPPLRAGGAARCFEPLRLDGSLVAGTAKRSAKLARTKQWLKLHSEPGQPQPPDSCDASGEYTEDSSDEDPASVSSEDVHNCSVATYREVTTAGCSSSVSGSNEAILDQDTPGSERAPRPPFGLGMGHSDSGSSKVVLRNKRRGLLTGERPWSVSGLPQLMAMSVGSLPTGGAAGELSQFSISESALHQLAAPGSATAAGKADGMEMMASSSTVEESVAHTTCAGSSSGAGSLRRRKMRSRKRTQSRRCDSGSDGVYPLPDSPAQRTPPSRLLPFKTSSPLSSPGKHAAQRPGGIVKSGSFSGTPAARASSERLSCSDPAAHRRSARVVSSTETDEDDKSGVGVGASPGLPVPVFRLGPEEGGISVAAVRARRRAGAILGTGSDVEKLSIHSTEQASWDSYQEKYLSEPYSEDPPDPEAARRLLDWDDYRTFLDSQSDCASSLSTNPNNGSPAVHRRRIRNPNGLEMEEGDSDTDLEDLRQRIQQSQTQYAEHEKMFETELASVASSVILGKDYADFLQTCSENCRCLNAILEDVDVRSRLTPQERRDIAGLANSWSTLQDRAQELLRLKKEMDALKDDLLKSRGVALSSELGDMDQLDERIRLVKAEHESLQERKKLKLPYLNHAVHRFRQQALKEQVAELYGIYDDTLDMVSQHLSDLQQTKVAWQQFEQHLAELQRALRSDQDTLKQVDRALQGGQVSTAVASSVREVARALSEKQEHSSVTMGQSSLVVLADAQTAALRCSEGGSLSDSGISDTGSDQEPSERERRLANLRRLARQLEAVLGPGSRALDSMREKIQQTESELRGLQRTCRDLIVRTAVCVGAASRTGAGVAAAASGVAQPCLERVGGGVRLAASSRASPEPLSRTHRGSNGSAKWRKSRKRGLREADEDPEDPEDPEAGKARPRHWLWRAMRAALPFQVAIMALLCVACLLEPHCCDAINNLNLSLSPQLRYVRGPPPV